MRNEKYKNWEEGWAVVEVGDDVIAGWIACEEKFLQIDVPAFDEEPKHRPAFTRFIAIHAISNITPCSEWGVNRVLEIRDVNTLCDALYLYAYTQHASEPDGTIPEPIDPKDIPF